MLAQMTKEREHLGQGNKAYGTATLTIDIPEAESIFGVIELVTMPVRLYTNLPMTMVL
jgi:hypothetical protein